MSYGEQQPVPNILSIVVTIVGLVFGGIIFLTLLFGSWYNVNEGEVGVLFQKFGSNQGFSPTEIQQGYGMKMPFRDRIIELPFRTQQIGFYGSDEEKGTYSAIQTKDNNGIFFAVDLTVRYRIDPTQASEFVEQKGEGLAAMEQILATSARADSTRGVFGKYAQEDVPENLIEIAKEIQLVLQERIDREASGKLNPGFIIIEAVDIRKVSFDAKIEEAIINKQTAKQTAERKDYELQEAVTQREITLVNADRDKQSMVLAAQGNAEAILLEAEAKAKGIKMVNDAYQQMPEAYVLTKFAEAIKPTDKVYLGFDSLGGNTLNLLNLNEATGLVASQQSIIK